MPQDPQVAKQRQAAKAQAAAASENAKAAASNGAGAVGAAVEEAASDVKDAASQVDVKKISGGFGNLGQGFLFLGIATYMGALSYQKFRAVFEQSYTTGG